MKALFVNSCKVCWYTPIPCPGVYLNSSYLATELDS